MDAALLFLYYLPSFAMKTLEPVLEQLVDRSIHVDPLGSLNQICVDAKKQSFKGLFIALSILITWATSLITLFALDLSKLHFFYISLAILLQTFLYAGLFITSHDAMHRSLFPRNYKVNDALGTICVFLYAFFSYEKLYTNHWLHHRYPASDRDPDFHDGQFSHPVLWFLTFIRRYYGWPQLTAATITYYGANILLHIPSANLILFWVVPALLSSMQLFYFGTFLPHHEPQDGHTSIHRARTTPLPVIWSFLTCYHFGYHEEHHEYPAVPWWQLPTIHKLRIEAAVAPTELLVQ